MNKKIRLSKLLAASGVASRRAAEELIFSGRVMVGGSVVTIPQTLVDYSDKIKVDGKLVEEPEKKVYFLLNKPKGYLCSNKRLSERSRLVIDLFEDLPYRLFTVGRLDRDTEGLIVVTNDGQFAQALIHPSKNIHKEYVAKTLNDVSDEHLKKITGGTWVQGTFIKPVRASKMRRGTVKVVVSEGKKHEVRELLDQAGLTLKELKRVRIGHLLLGNLETGQYRPLSRQEIAEVMK